MTSVLRGIDYTSDHESFRDSCRAFLDRHVRPFVDDHRDRGTLPRELWKQAGSEGLLGLEVPEQYGGLDAGDYRFNAVLFEELATVNVATGAALGMHADVAAPYIVDHGTAEQKARWLPPMCTGEYIAAVGMTEPSGGSDLAALKTNAVRDGADWIINGSKTFITNGYSADIVITAVRTTPGTRAKGISLFVLEATDPGFHRGRKLDKVGLPESDTAELFFEDLRVSPDRLLGEVDRGFVHMMQNLAQERLGTAITNVAHAGQILEETLDYCRTRHAFGQPIGSHQHNKFLLAELVTQLEVARTYVDRAVTAHLSGELTAVDAAKAKWWAAEVQNEVLDHCLQLHGGYGFMNEYRVARAWKDARISKIWGGSNEIMKELIGRDLGF